MIPRSLLGLLVALVLIETSSPAAPPAPLPKVADGWKIELAAQAPQIVFPTAAVAAPDGTLYLGQDPMDMPGPPTKPIDSVVALRNGKVTVFAEGLWAVMGLEWVDDTLYVVHAPYLSAFRDRDGDGRADSRVDLVTGLGPRLPGFSGINDHVASGVRMGMDGYLYISVGDKGIPKGVGKDGTTIQLFGGGVIRVRPDGTGLEVVSTGERNPLSVALTTTDEVFTYGNDDDSKKWPNSLTHHIVGGHYGYPYEFLLAPRRALPIVAGEIGGSGAQGICYNEDGLPPAYRGNLFFCDWGLATVFRYEIAPKGATFVVKKKTPLVTRGELKDFRPFSLAVAGDGASLWLVDWAFDGWLADGPKTGRLYRLRYEGPDQARSAPRALAHDPAALIAALDHPAHSVRLRAQRELARLGPRAEASLSARLAQREPEVGRLHALWALDAIGTPAARNVVRGVLADRADEVRLQAARSAGIRRDRRALRALEGLLHDRSAPVRREAAIALGRLGDPAAGAPLLAALGEPDPFAAWSVRHALRGLRAWTREGLEAALLDRSRREAALRLTDEAWDLPVVAALSAALKQTAEPGDRARMVANLAGLYRRYPVWSGHWFGTNPLAGQLPRKTRDWDRQGMAAVLQGLAQGLADRDPGVRRQAIAGLREMGPEAAPYLRLRLNAETDQANLIALVQALGVLRDQHAAASLAKLAQEGTRPEPVRAAALDALGQVGGPQALRSRFTLLFDAQAPPALVARALTPLGREGVLPANDIAGFLEHREPAVRAAAIAALNPKLDVPEAVQQVVIDRLTDSDPRVRRAAIAAVAELRLRQAIPRLLAVANEADYHTEATLALTALPDPQALPVYLAALQERNPELRRGAEQALLEIRDAVKGDLEKQLGSGKFTGPAAEALERVVTRFQPIADWKVIGPFARTTAQVFVGERSIDFGRTHSGAEGRTIAWTSRKAEADTGRVVLDDFKGGAGDRGGFGYDTNGSPDLCAFGYAEIQSDSDRPALLLLGSSGTLLLTVNEKWAHTYVNFAGRPYAPDSDVVRVQLQKGTNRILAVSRQGIGTWSFSVQVSAPSAHLLAARPAAPSVETLRSFALSHAGDPKKGEALFYDARGIGCVKCHSAAGKGTAQVGPDLTGLALKYDRAEIIRSVLEPSSRIATGYQPVLLALADGKVLTGQVRAETDTHLELVDAEAKVTRVPKSEIETRRLSDVSTMPAGVAETLSPVEFADLISFLQELKSPPKK
jgi:putative membrane-bound dehydrogenase-like protein